MCTLLLKTSFLECSVHIILIIFIRVIH